MANQGISMLVPTLLEMGTRGAEAALDRARRSRGEVVWCQGYSEPGAGSDLANLRTAAVEDGDDFVINGQKIWTSTAQHADMIFCLVRTEADAAEARRHQLSDLPDDDAGHRGAPAGHHDRAAPSSTRCSSPTSACPRAAVVGERGQGWAVANATLKHERGMLGDPNAAEARLAAIIEIMKRETVDGARLIDNPVFRDRLMRLQGEVLAMKFHGLRLLTAAEKREPAGIAGLIVKLRGCELNHQLAALAIDALGEAGRALRRLAAPARRRGLAAPLHVRPGPDHRRGHRPDPEEHHLRAGPRHAARTQGGGLMEFGLSDEQRMLQASVAGVLERVSPLERIRAFAAGDNSVAGEVWGALSELGVPALMIDEAHGGLGLTLLDAALVSEALGAAVAPVPFLGAVLAPLALQAAGSEAQQAEWLPKLASGKTIAAIAIGEQVAGARDGAGVSAENGRLTGKALFIPGGMNADVVVVADRAGGLHLVEKAAEGVERIPLTSIDRTRPMAELRFDNTPAEPLARDNGAALAALRDAGWVILAADTLGASQAMIDKAVAYAKERQQFGRVIGSFQAVKHLCAEMAAQLEPCRALVWYAAHARDAAPAEASCGRRPRQGACSPKSAASWRERPPRCTAAWASPTSPACTTGSSAWASAGSCSAARNECGKSRRDCRVSFLHKARSIKRSKSRA